MSYYIVVFQDGADTALLIDRYRYEGLLPCITQELKALGYNVRFVHLFMEITNSKIIIPKIINSGLSKQSLFPEFCPKCHFCGPSKLM